MLIQCPECELQVSDKALTCPHCGYPLKSASQTDQNVKKKRGCKKHRRLPNGFGQISELKGRNLRKPFRALVTVGKTEEGRPIVKPLKPNSYFETYNDAYTALLEYNRNPYDLVDSTTMQQLYERWLPVYTKSVKSRSAIDNAKSVWAYFSEIYNMRVADVRVRHLRSCMENGQFESKGIVHRTTPDIRKRMKTTINSMFDYAVEWELTDKNYAREFAFKEVNGPQKKAHIPFEPWEMDLFWQKLDEEPLVDMLLIQCYSGWRPQELTSLRIADVDLKEWTIVGGMKTEAGIDRTVPIHPKIRDLVKKRYEDALSLDSEYLFNTARDQFGKRRPFDYHKYEGRFKRFKLKYKLNPEHALHDCRVQFVTMAKAAGVNEYAIKRIIGHYINDLTERVYTERSLDWLREELHKIP